MNNPLSKSNAVLSDFETNLSSSERYYRTLIHSLHDDLLVIDRDYRITDINNMALKSVGKTRRDVIGRFCYEVSHGMDKPCDEHGLPCPLQHVLDTGEAVQCCHEHVKSNGEIVHVDIMASPIKDPEGHVTHIIKAVRDISDLIMAQEALRRNEAFLNTILDAIPAAVFYKDKDGRYLGCNRTFETFFGTTRERLSDETKFDILTPELAEICPTENSGFLEGDGIQQYEYQIKNAHGVPRDVIFNRAVFTDSQGAVSGMVVAIVDITERKRAEKDLQRSNDLLQAVIEAAPTAIIALDLEGNVHSVWNPAAERMLGWNAREVMGRPLPTVPVESKEEFRAFREQIRSGKTIDGVEVRRQKRDGTPIDYSIYASPLHDAEDRIIGNIAVLADISERKRSEEKKAILDEIANIFLTIPDEAIFKEVLTVVLRVMKSKYGIFGYIGENGDLIIPSLTKEIWNECRVSDKSIVFPADSWGNSLWGRAIREKKAFASDGPFHTPEGHIPIDHFLTVPIVYGNEIIGIISVANGQQSYTEEDSDILKIIAGHISPILHARIQSDIQGRRRMEAEEHLKESEEKYRLLITNADEAIFIVQDEVVKFPNPKALEMSGYSAEELANIPFIDLIHPRDKLMVFERYLRRLEGDRHPQPYPFRIKDKKGKLMWVQLTTALVVWEKKPGILCFLRDITEEKKLEAQLQQAQKMESIGTLAGGIAHDFNNILAPIIGCTEMSLEDVATDTLLYENLQAVLKAGMRAKDLVQQILTFSRQSDQVLNPLCAQTIIKEVLKLSRSTLPSTIQIQQNISNECGLVMADPTQIHQVVMNLITNAYHAMEDTGGKLSVSLKEIELSNDDIKDPDMIPGPYVCLKVSDTGVGMEKSEIERIFEPYYTTKDRNKGTGLGLSVVHGVVKNYGGDISVYSEPGQGSIFRVYLPVIKSWSETVAMDIVAPVPKGTERILLVDDEDAVVRLYKQLLGRLGYDVTARASGTDALEAFRARPEKFDLVITDMTMPNMTGVQLAQKLLGIRPDIPIIICTGFSTKIDDEKIKAYGIRGYVMKPVVQSELAQKIREVLAKDRVNIR